MRVRFRWPALLAAVGVWALPGQGEAQKNTWDGVFTSEQAARGGEIYGGMCASCHGPQLGGIDAAPGLNGGSFYANWNGISLGEMADRVRKSMPANSPGIMTRQQVSDVLAYIFSRNGMPAGTEELPSRTAYLRAIAFRAQRGG
jgi:mono/diheme cytochrome c family protein